MRPLSDAVAALRSSLASEDAPREMPEIGFMCSPAEPIGVRACALTMGDVALQPLSGCSFYRHALDLSFRLTGNVADVSVAALSAGIAQSFSSHLRASIMITAHELGVALSHTTEARVSARVAEHGIAVRVLIPPAAWDGVSAAHIDALSWMDVPIESPLLPLHFRVAANHASAPADDVYYAAARGDCVALMAALVDGGSVDAMCLGDHLRPPFRPAPA